MLLLILADTTNSIDADLDRTQHGTEQRALPGEHARHVAAEWLGQQEHQKGEQHDLQPTAEDL